MDIHTIKPKNLISESSSQLQESKKSSTNKTTPKVMLTKTTKVHKVHKNTTTTKTVTAQTDNKPKQKPSKMDIVKAKAAKAKTSATTTATTQPKCKSEGSSSVSASASASASTSDPARKKKDSTKGKQEATGNKKADGIKYQKRTASEVDDSDVENESEAEGQLGNHRPTKTSPTNRCPFFITCVPSRHIQKDKAEDTAVRSTLKRKRAVRNDAIWKMITGGVVASPEPSTATTMITSNKTAVTAVSCADFCVVDEVREVVDQLSIQEDDSENKTGDVTDMNARGGQSYDAPTAASTSPRRKTLDVVDDAAFEKLWDVARGKFD
ncbi:hypothetical protein BKA57DRAFT_494651 [Linnemannia elongata]|nr:hypothetical protein BKA57DRAFT_494651 [Linnemannia elongata]